MTPSKTLFYLCISFVVGVFLASIVKIPQIFSWGFLILAILAIIASVLFKKNIYTVIGFCILFLIIGMMRFQISEFNIASNTLSKFNDTPEKITLTGQILGEPDVRDTSQKLKVKVESMKSVVLVTVGRYPEYQYLDTIKIMGKLKTPPEFLDFNYKNYLMKDGVYSLMDYPKVELASQQHDYNILSFLYEKILFLKNRLMNSVDMHFSPPQSDMLKGIVFGNDKNMPKETKNAFNTTGLSHLTAVSGSNIVILIEILMVFLLALGLWRSQALYVAILLIWIYIVLIGFPISGVRAAVMGSVGLVAQTLGRQHASSRALVMTGSLMLLQNPMLLLYDISFQLSFLASMGIVYLKPSIDMLLRFNKDPSSFADGNFGKAENSRVSTKDSADKEKKSGLKNALKGLLDIVSITAAAQIFTLPIIVYNFGRVSLVSPITNVLVLPIIPILTVMGFLVSMVGVASNMLGFIFSLPCLLLLGYILKILDIFSKPWAVKIIENLSWIWLAVYYVILAFLIYYLNKFKKPKFLGY